MAKAAPKKQEKAEKDMKKLQKPKGRPVRGASLVKEASENDVPSSSSPRHVVVEVGEEAPDKSLQQESALDAITTQNVAEAITTENPSEYVTVRKNVSSSRLFFIALSVGVLLGTLIFGGLVLYDSYGSTFGLPAPTPTETPKEPTPTEVVLDLSSYNVQVLNGTGVAGSAKIVADLLTDKGFENVTAGNASEFGYTDTEVQIKGSVPKALFATIQDSLPGYSVVEVTSLPDDSNFDVVITVGKTKIEEDIVEN